MLSLLTSGRRRRGTRTRGSSRARRAAVVLAAILAEVASTWWRAGRLGGNVVVRCRQSHVFTTIWIPAVSLKSIRLGPWRVQRCPVGRHWSLVTPLKDSELTDEQRRSAAAHRDVRVP
ncbi:MAG: hypothetical protein JO156_10765 [Solirubrobacterales bacterium]|nr:hypothetical protein [Solirubrobacterales bacterium]